MNFSATWVHYAEIAFAIHNFASHSCGTEVDDFNFWIFFSFRERDSFRIYLNHRLPVAINELALQANMLAFESGNQIVGAMLPRCDQQILRELIASRSADKQHRIGFDCDYTLEASPI